MGRLTSACASLLLCSLWSFLAAQPAAAAPRVNGQDSEYRDVPLSAVSSPDLPVGTKIRVVGKYKERINEEVTLYDCAIVFVVEDPALSRQLLEIKAKRDNLVLTGRVAQAKNLDRIVEVDTLSRGLSDRETFQEEFVEIRSRDDVAALLELAGRVKQTHRAHGDAAILTLAREILRRAFRVVGKTAAGSEASSALVFARRVRELLGPDDDLGIEILLDLGNRFADDANVRTYLKESNCRRYQNRWMTYAQFKTAEGLVFHKGQWHTATEKAVLDAVDRFLAEKKSDLLLLRRRTEREYSLLSAAGKVEEGMTRKEVYAALGYPDEVKRRPLLDGEFDLWSYEGEDEYYFFFNGVLVQAPAKQ